MSVMPAGTLTIGRYTGVPSAAAAALWSRTRCGVGGHGLPASYRIALASVPRMNGVLAAESVMVRCPDTTIPCRWKERNLPVRRQLSAMSATSPSKCAALMSQTIGSLSMLVKTYVSMELDSLLLSLSCDDIVALRKRMLVDGVGEGS